MSEDYHVIAFDSLHLLDVQYRGQNHVSRTYRYGLNRVI